MIDLLKTLYEIFIQNCLFVCNFSAICFDIFSYKTTHYIKTIHVTYDKNVLYLPHIHNKNLIINQKNNFY